MTDQKYLLKSDRVDDRPLIMYFAVAGDVESTWVKWRAGLVDADSTTVTYSCQLFNFCKRGNFRGIVSYPWPTKRSVGDESIVVKSRPVQKRRNGLAFYLQKSYESFQVLYSLLKNRPRYAVVMDGICFFFLLAPARWAGIRIIMSVHTAFWPPFLKVSFGRRVVLALEGWFLRTHCHGLLAVSHGIVAQAKEIAHGDFRSSVSTPLYGRESFQRIEAADPPGDSVHLLFSGRVEVNKGVLDLLEIVVRLKRVMAGHISLVILGDGDAYNALREHIGRLGLGDNVSAPGACGRERVISELSRAQIVMVPTQSSFPEGYAKSAVESVLAVRPVITSAICLALDDLRGAVEEARPDDVQSYVDAVLNLCRDPALYAERIHAASVIREKFFHESSSWGAKLQGLIDS